MDQCNVGASSTLTGVRLFLKTMQDVDGLLEAHCIHRTVGITAKILNDLKDTCTLAAPTPKANKAPARTSTRLAKAA